MTYEYDIIDKIYKFLSTKMEIANFNKNKYLFFKYLT